MSYGFGVAASLLESKTHPRILFGPAELDRLRKAAQRGAGQKLLTSLRQRVAPLIRTALDTDDLAQTIAQWNQTWDRPGTFLMFGLFDIALVGELDNNDEAIAACKRVFATLPAASDQSRPGVRTLGYAMPVGVVHAYDLLHSRLSTKERRAVVDFLREKSIEQTLTMLSKSYYKNAAGNITLQGMEIGLTAVLGILGDPGAGRLDAQRDTLVSYLEATVNTALGPQGYPEEDIGYGTGVTAGLAPLIEAVRRAGWYDAYTQTPRYSRFGDAVLHLVQPWGEMLCNTGDHGSTFGFREFILPRLATETQDPALLWLMSTINYSHGMVHPTNTNDAFEKEIKPAPGLRMPVSAYSLLVLDDLKKPARPKVATTPTEWCDPQRGIVSFRSGWGDMDTMLTFDGSQRSPAGQGHAHASGGHFNLSAVGEVFALDTGRYANEQNQHNVALIDGQSGRSNDGEWKAVQHAAVLTGYRPDPFCDTASVDTTMQHNCIWARRTVGLVHGPKAPAWVWTIDDINKANDWAEYWWTLNTSPENTIKTHRDHAAITGWRQGNSLDVWFAVPNAGDFPKAHQLKIVQDQHEINSYKYNPTPKDRVAEYPRPASMELGPVWVRPRLIGKVAGYNGRFMSIMIPRQAGEAPAKVERLPGLMNSLAIRVTFDDVQDTFIWAYEHRMLEADGIVARGQWVVVRRDRKTKRVLKQAIAEGTSLIVDGVKRKI